MLMLWYNFVVYNVKKSLNFYLEDQFFVPSMSLFVQTNIIFPLPSKVVFLPRHASCRASQKHACLTPYASKSEAWLAFGESLSLYETYLRLAPDGACASVTDHARRESGGEKGKNTI